MTRLLTVLAPLSGAIIPLSQIPDAVFSQRILGDGLALDPAEDVLYAPFDAIITNLNKNLHALVIAHKGAELLLHVGLDSAALKGAGFTALVQQGDRVKAGQPLLRFDRTLLAKRLSCAWVVCIVTSPRTARIHPVSQDTTQKGQPLFTLELAENLSCAQTGTHPTLQSAPITLLNKHGLHARPAGQLAKLAATYPYNIYICKGSRRANAKSITAIMGLALAQADQVTLLVEGPLEQAQAFLTLLETEFAKGFGE